MHQPPSEPALDPPALFDAARHESPAGAGWDPEAAAASIRAIVGDAAAAFDPDGLWPAHPLDDPDTPETRYSMLYMGAGGVIWGLHRLCALGHADPDPRWNAAVPGLVDRNRAMGATTEGQTASFLMGDSGLLLQQWKTTGSADVADRLFEVVQQNLHHPAREMLWGSPGTMLAALHMAEATSDRRWADVLARGASILLDDMEWDERIGAWVWRQDLYGRTRCFLGAGHGFAGNVFPILRGAHCLSSEVVEKATSRAWTILDTLALRRDGCINWHPIHDPEAVKGRIPLVQDCHGAPGIVVRLAGVPRGEAWDALLAQAGELTWRAGPLAKGPGLCHGTAGNGYALLMLWSRTGDPVWLERARAFAMHAIGQVDTQRRATGRGRYSLWTGDIGVALYLASCIGGDSRFPTLDVF